MVSSGSGGGSFEGRVIFNGGVGGSGGAHMSQTQDLKNTATSDDKPVTPIKWLQTGETDIAQMMF